ncbi:ribosomal protein S6 kinase-related protein isoform X1 [Neodiprion fabricii]|uniref:ribosomal protein S6 kinase-related protein isoform X1 n=1 Tax=Neodiprion fabricii TaxID=2872261 RepID=UPI001ED913C8|nr:ribosomal protein S6 kinase-related protein isoform X1 [Neodiprion fabricii]
MGNCVDKTKKYTAENARQEPQVAYASYSSLDNVLSRRSSRFALFSGSSAGNSTTSAHVEWSRRSRASRVSRISRISRRTGSQDTPEDPCSLSKTRWPVPQFEAAFLPEFKIKETAYKTNYDIIDLISKGAYGQVYKVRSRIDGEIFALKVLNKAQIIAEDAIERVKDEVRIQQVVGHHPFVVNASRYWQDKRRLYVGSDYVSGGELFTLVEGYGNLPEDAVRILVAEVALAIDFLHNAGIIHRDVKASNVLLDEEGHAQLIDFGFAKWLKHGQKTSTLCGTPQYIAPEILRGEPYGHAIDWWSLGVLMYFLLTSEYPVPSEPKTSPTSIAETPTVSFSCFSSPSISPSTGAVDLLKRLLAPDPVSRLRSILGLQRVSFYKNRDFRGYTSRSRIKEQDGGGGGGGGRDLSGFTRMCSSGVAVRISPGYEEVYRIDVRGCLRQRSLQSYVRRVLGFRDASGRRLISSKRVKKRGKKTKNFTQCNSVHVP